MPTHHVDLGNSCQTTTQKCFQAAASPGEGGMRMRWRCQLTPMSPADDQATGTGAAIGPQLQKLGKKSEWRLYLDASEPRSLHVRDPEPVVSEKFLANMDYPR